MKDPKRLRDERPDRLALLLLEAGRDDAPSKEWVGRTLAGAATAGTTLAATATASAGAAASLAQPSLPIALVVKWIGLGALAGTVASAGAGALLPQSAASARVKPATLEPPRSTGATAPLSRKPAAEAARPLSPPVVRERVVTPSSAPKAHRSLPAPAPAVEPQEPALPVEAVGSAPPSEGDAEREARAVREEVRALGRAKAALNENKAAEALRIIAAYRARFPQGRLRPEAAYLEMEAELARGNDDRARALAAGLAVGETPNAERARAILRGAHP